MTGRADPDGELTLADVQREFPGYECWRGVSGRCYARLPGRPRRHKYDVCGQDPRELRERVIRHKAERDAAIAETLAQVFKPSAQSTPPPG